MSENVCYCTQEFLLYDAEFLLSTSDVVKIKEYFSLGLKLIASYELIDVEGNKTV